MNIRAPTARDHTGAFDLVIIQLQYALWTRPSVKLLPSPRSRPNVITEIGKNAQMIAAFTVFHILSQCVWWLCGCWIPCELYAMPKIQYQPVDEVIITLKINSGVECEPKLKSKPSVSIMRTRATSIWFIVPRPDYEIKDE